MTSSLNKKIYNLQIYNKVLVPLNSVPLAFFLSRFGGKLTYKVGNGLSIKSCKVSLIRKILKDDIFSGPMYFIFPTPHSKSAQFTDFDFLKVFRGAKLFSSTATTARLQSVLAFKYILDYPFFEFLVNPLVELPTSLIGLKFLGALVPLTFFAARLLIFLKFILNQNLMIFGALGFLKRPGAAFI